jgi:glutaredoxin-related protein
MTRAILPDSRLHPAIRERVAALHSDVIHEMEAAIAANRVVVVGMAFNPFPAKARRLLDDTGVVHRYIEYGSYLSQWRRRNALKMWTGWPTFPMVFVKGVLVGGFTDLEKLAQSGELHRMIAAAD